MKILIHSNAPWVPSGYGQQTAQLVPGLASLGHDVAVSAFYGLSGSPMAWDGHMVYPAGQHPYGWDVLAGHAAHFGADLVLTVMDTYVMDPDVLAGLRAAGVKVAQWTPVDCAPLGAVDKTCLEVSGAIPIAMSRHGEGELAEAGLDPLYVPHAIDTSVFAPLPDRAAARAAMGLPASAFIIGICAANKDALRKGFPEQFRAFATFRLGHRDALLLVHTVAEGKGGLDLRALAEACGIADAVIFSDQYGQVAGLVEPRQMAGWLGVIDVLSACAYGEGFGIPIIEAQACGTPVIVTDASAMPELAGAGWRVKGEPAWNPVHRAWWVKPSVARIADAYEHAYAARGGREGLAAKARKHALRYDAGEVLREHWKPVLDEIMGRPEIIRHSGLRWMIRGRDATGDLLALGHESALDPIVEGLLPEGGTFLDVGAHVGHYALRLARKAGQVVAIEPNQNTLGRLHDNIRLNELANVQVFSAAAWDSATQLHLSTPSGHNRDGSAQVRAEGDGDLVAALPLDMLLKADDLAGRLDLVKLDVEGADLHALRGMRQLLAEYRPVLFIEDHSVYGMYERADLDALLAELGYDVEDLPLYRGYLIARPQSTGLGLAPSGPERFVRHGVDH